MTTGERIRIARKNAGLTQKQLGEKLNLSYQTIAQWENGLRNPKYETIIRIAEALNLSTLDFLQDYVHVNNDLGETAIFLRDLNGQAENMLRTRGLPINGEFIFSGEHPELERAWVKLICGEDDKETTERLLTAFSKLDFWGQQVAVDLVETLSSNPSFQRKDQQQSDNSQAETSKTKKDPPQD